MEQSYVEWNKRKLKVDKQQKQKEQWLVAKPIVSSMYRFRINTPYGDIQNDFHQNLHQFVKFARTYAQDYEGARKRVQKDTHREFVYYYYFFIFLRYIFIKLYKPCFLSTFLYVKVCLHCALWISLYLFCFGGRLQFSVFFQDT